MDYSEVQPQTALRPFVRCFWRLVGPAAVDGVRTERIVPDGCAEIVLNRAAPFRRIHRDGSSHRQAAVLLVGQIQRALSLEPTGEVDVLGIRFEPGGLFEFLGIPMHELVDRDLCLGQADSGLFRGLRAANDRSNPGERITEVERVLARGLARRDACVGGLVPEVVRRIESGDEGQVALAHSLGVSRRQIERAFRTEVGLAPKLYRRIRRIQSVLARLDGGAPPANWAATALTHGYADQSHMIRDFRLLVGTTPARYLSERTPMGDFFERASVSHSFNTLGPREM